MLKTLSFVFFLTFTFILLGQSTGTLLLIPQDTCKIIIDGDEVARVGKGSPFKVELIEGEHYIQGVKLSDKEEKEFAEVVTIEANRQKVVKINFGLDNSQQTTKLTESIKGTIEPIEITDVTVTMPGRLSAAASNLSKDDYEYSKYPVFYYFLQKEDVLVIDLIPLNEKGTNAIRISSYPDWNVIYSDFKLTALENFQLTIPEKGIYVVEVGTNHTFDRRAQLIVKRIPKDKERADISSKVVKKKKLNVVSIQEPMQQWINSTSNESFKGGSAELVIPVNLPLNTLEWYYIISASRKKETIDANLKNVSLFKDINKAILGINPTTLVLNIGLDLLSQPPGSDYCDIYLLDYANMISFKQDQEFTRYAEGSRENVTSAKVKITNLVQPGEYYLGLRNRDSFNGIAVGIEVVAITYEDYYAAVAE